ncbi:ATPase [Micromonospora sp. WMMD812]|uniref:ATPase n=1 Tax=Micromonospora sp. WMMD812 TaxID=3015152 RepID=UPI00248BDE52|nr:ATPase [Micromonospora sp. WMMD812]WBB68938.1 ATPase [Micromonospora sp. WMMD812]
MRFSVVEIGYDQRQVDSCLDELGFRLTRLAAWAESAAGPGREGDRIRQEASGLCGLLRRLDLDDAAVVGRSAGEVDREAGAILALARVELDAAREEARQLRERAYAEAVQARRDFEAALEARRRREARVDEILSEVTVEPVPVDTPTAAAGVPATRVAAGGVEGPAEPPTGRDGAPVR